MRTTEGLGMFCLRTTNSTCDYSLQAAKKGRLPPQSKSLMPVEMVCQEAYQTTQFNVSSFVIVVDTLIGYSSDAKVRLALQA